MRAIITEISEDAAIWSRITSNGWWPKMPYKPAHRNPYSGGPCAKWGVPSWMRR
jgi:hypothetical protein